MLANIFQLVAVFIISLAAFITLLISDWRVSICCLAVQFAGVFLLAAQVWPLALAFIILIAGWLSGAILGMAVISLPRNPSTPGAARTARQRLNPLFNLLAAVIIYMLVISLAPQTQNWLPMMGLEQSLSALTLICFGMLRLALDANPLSTAAALLSIVSGFEVIYATLTSAPFAVGGLAIITLSIALAGAYLLLAPSMEENS